MLSSFSYRISRVYQEPSFFWFVLVFVTTFLVLVILRGVYVGPDSLTYLRTAEVFFTHQHADASVQFPPLYSILMSLCMSLHLSELQSVRFLNLVFFVSSTWVCCHLFMCISEVKSKEAILLSTLLMSSYVVFIPHQQMMTESLFVLLTFLNIALLERYAHHPSMKLIMLASLVAALSALTRYAGIASVVTTIFIVLIFAPEKNLKQWVKISMLWGGSTLVFGFWLLRNNILYSTFTGREVSSHERHFEGLLHYMDTLSQLYFPQMVPEGIRLWAFTVLIVLTVLLQMTLYRMCVTRTGGQTIKRVGRLVTIINLVLAGHAALMILALFVDPFLPVQRRLLTPLYALFLLLHFVLLAYFCRSAHLRLLFFAYAGLYLLLNVSRLGVQELKDNEYRFGYASDIYTTSPLIEFMQSVAPRSEITSNGDDVIAWHIRRPVSALPKLINPRTNRSNPTFDIELNEVYCRMQTTNGYLVWFNNITWRDYLPSLDLLQERYKFQLVRTFTDGVVYMALTDDRQKSCAQAQ